MKHDLLWRDNDPCSTFSSKHKSDVILLFLSSALDPQEMYQEKISRWHDLKKVILLLAEPVKVCYRTLRNTLCCSEKNKDTGCRFGILLITLYLWISLFFFFFKSAFHPSYYYVSHGHTYTHSSDLLSAHSSPLLSSHHLVWPRPLDWVRIWR